jgi:hypothetical protein
MAQKQRRVYLVAVNPEPGTGGGQTAVARLLGPLARSKRRGHEAALFAESIIVRVIT